MRGGCAWGQLESPRRRDEIGVFLTRQQDSCQALYPDEVPGCSGAKVIQAARSACGACAGHAGVSPRLSGQDKASASNPRDSA
eukprot:3941185-Rhodomonas_salina.7